MDWKFISLHLISGIIPEYAALALYFYIMHGSGARQKAGHVIASFVFCFYLVGILTMTGVCLRGSFSPRIVLIPFADIINSPLHAFLNILLFVPLGIFLPLLYENHTSFRRTVPAGFLISLSAELAQMFSMGITDISDIITNTAGTCLGFLLYKAVCQSVPGTWIRKCRADSLQDSEPLLFWTGTLLIMLTVQITVFRALFRS